MISKGKKIIALLIPILLMVTVVALIGNPDISNISKQNIKTYQAVFPFDDDVFSKRQAISCVNNAEQVGEVVITVLFGNRAGGAESLTLPAGGIKEKLLSSFTALKQKQAAAVKRGVLIINGSSPDVRCSLTNVKARNSRGLTNYTFTDKDAIVDTGYVINMPDMYKKSQVSKLYIYNLDGEKRKFEISAYAETGEKIYKRNKKLKAYGRKIINLKLQRRTYQINSAGEYLAFVRTEDRNGKAYITKSQKPFIAGLAEDINGDWVVANTTSAPTTFTYTITHAGQKQYQGSAWVMPHSIRVIPVYQYTKNQAEQKVFVTGYNFFYPQVCQQDGSCAASTERAMLVMDVFPSEKIKGSAEKVQAITVNNDARITYDADDVNTPAIPVTCRTSKKIKDSDDDGLCDYEEEAFGTNGENSDTDGDGIADGDELYVNFSSPFAVDGDGDGYNDMAEMQAGTVSFSPDSYPGRLPLVWYFQVIDKKHPSEMLSETEVYSFNNGSAEWPPAVNNNNKNLRSNFGNERSALYDNGYYLVDIDKIEILSTDNGDGAENNIAVEDKSNLVSILPTGDSDEQEVNPAEDTAALRKTCEAKLAEARGQCSAGRVPCVAADCDRFDCCGVDQVCNKGSGMCQASCAKTSSATPLKCSELSKSLRERCQKDEFPCYLVKDIKGDECYTPHGAQCCPADKYCNFSTGECLPMTSGEYDFAYASENDKQLCEIISYSVKNACSSGGKKPCYKKKNGKCDSADGRQCCNDGETCDFENGKCIADNSTASADANSDGNSNEENADDEGDDEGSAAANELICENGVCSTGQGSGSGPFIEETSELPTLESKTPVSISNPSECSKKRRAAEKKCKDEGRAFCFRRDCKEYTMKCYDELLYGTCDTITGEYHNLFNFIEGGDTLNNVINRTNNVLVIFTTDDCPYCEKVMGKANYDLVLFTASVQKYYPEFRVYVYHAPNYYVPGMGSIAFPTGVWFYKGKIYKKVIGLSNGSANIFYDELFFIPMKEVEAQYK